MKTHTHTHNIVLDAGFFLCVNSVVVGGGFELNRRVRIAYNEQKVRAILNILCVSVRACVRACARGIMIYEIKMLTFVESSSNFVCSAIKRTQKQLRCISVGHFECEKAGLFIIGLLMPPDTLSISGIFDRSSDSDCGIGIEP